MSGSTSGQGNPLRYHSRIRQSGTERQPETHPLTWRLRDDGEVVWLGEYLDKDGYQSVRRALAESDPQGIITVVKDANVRGRGGAGFSAGVKWSLTLQGGDMPRGYLICNADEMEPGTFKDRLLMEQQPHLLIEGMILGARANNARQGYIFLRGEYVEAARVLNRAIDEAREAGWLGPDMGDNAYTAFDPLFLSYHANIDRMLEVWIRNHPGAQFTTQTPLQPFLGAGATDVSYSSADHWRYTSIGEMAQDSRRIGYDYGEPLAKQFTGDAARKKSPTAVKAKPSKPGKMAKEAGVSADPFVATRAEAKIMDDGPWVVFDDVRCTHDSYLIDVFINQADATPNDATSCNMHYVGRFSRIGMGLVDDKGRCVTQGVSRVLNAGPTIYSLDLRPEDKPQISLVVTHLDTGRVVTADEYKALPGFIPQLVWGDPRQPIIGQMAPRGCCSLH